MGRNYRERGRARNLPAAWTYGPIGVSGLVLAAFSLVGMTTNSVAQPGREIGIRIAIGADPRKVVWMVLRQGLQLGAAGVAAGLVVAFFTCRVVASSVSGGGLSTSVVRVGPLDFAAVALTLLTITVLAALAPALRASRVDPIRSLRDE